MYDNSFKSLCLIDNVYEIIILNCSSSPLTQPTFLCDVTSKGTYKLYQNEIDSS
jgi:hypothetical protein